MITASDHGHVELVQFLLRQGAEIEAMDILAKSPLRNAMIGGHLELVRVLLEHGADPNALDEKGYTTFYLGLAWVTPRIAVARLLLSHGADVNLRYKANNQAPLHMAKGEEIARLLLEHGADANALDIGNRTPLHCASFDGRVGTARVLLEHGVDANARDVNNATPLHHVSGKMYMDQRGNLDVVRLLPQYGSDIQARDAQGRTPFARATRGNYDMIQLLLEHGVGLHPVTILDSRTTVPY
jgi:ankyrin repeat protein